jgi:hypothetical protein
MASKGQRSFTAQVSDWVAQTDQRIAGVFKESSVRVVRNMQTPVGAGGNMPIDTGYLRSSLQPSVNEMLPVNPKSRSSESEGPPVAYGPTESEIMLKIASLKVGDTFYATYGANYARYQEYGTSKMRGRGFVRLATQRWKALVNEVCAELRTRVESRKRTG